MISQQDHSIDFCERAIVGALLTGHNGSQRAVDMLGGVETCDIRTLRFRPVVAVTLDIRDEGGDPSIGNILDRLASSQQLAIVLGADGPGFLESLMNATPDVWDMPTWTRVVLDASRKRDAAAKLSQLQETIGRDPEQAIRTAERLLESLKGVHREKPTESLILKRMSDVEEQPLTWLWPNRFARGKFNQLQGDPGYGKTMVICDMAARVSKGAEWPDGSQSDGPGSVVIVTSEDDPADTLKPRLRRAGADMTKVHVLETAIVCDAKSGRLVREPFDIGKHVPLLTDSVKKLGDVSLMVIDPISAYTGKIDSHKNAEVRGMLVDFLAMIAQQNICLLGIIHQNKQIGGKSVYRASGSLAFTAAARSVWMIAPDHDDDRRRLMLPVKCNIAPRLDGMAYRIESDGSGPPFVHWEANPVPLTADGYLKQEENSDRKNDQDSARTKAVDFIQEQLKDGPMLSKDLESAIRANYIAPATYKRAREELQCRAEKDGKVWWTLLPGQKRPEITEESQDATSNTLDALDTVETHEPLKQHSQEYQ